MNPVKPPRISVIIALICLVLASAPLTPAHAAETHPAQVRDISDRAYEDAVLGLIDNAKESVVISMYMIVPSTKGPVAQLFKALENALSRGVSVEIYLNTVFPSGMIAPDVDEKPFTRLEEKGAQIYPVSQKYLHHDKLLIIDSRYVAEGSHNWSIRAMKQNHESSTLIDSPALAREKLSRLRNLPLEKDRLARQQKLEELKNPPSLPEDTLIPLPKALLLDKNLLPRMLSRHVRRAFNAYFLLVVKGYTVGRGKLPEEFPVSTKELADDLGFPTSWSRERLRWQETENILRELRDYYGLIDIEFREGTEEWVTIKSLPGPTFPVGLDFFDPDYLGSKPTRVKYLYLIKALLRSEGKTLDSYTRKEISEKYNIDLRQLYYGLSEQ